MKVLALRRFPGTAWDELRDVEYAGGPLLETLQAPRSDIDAVAVVAERVDSDLLDLLPGVRLVANYGAGYELIDVDACARRGVVVTNTPGVLDAATADLTMSLLLAVRRRVVEGDRYVRDRRWSSSWDTADVLGDEVTGMRLGIVGLGRIGAAVARRALGFEMELVYTRRRRLPIEEEEALNLGFRALDDLLVEADAVTLHLPLTPETRALLDRRRLALMRDSACLVNTARGAIVDERALVDELVSGRLRAGARRVRERAARAAGAARASERRPYAARWERDCGDTCGDDARARRQHPRRRRGPTAAERRLPC